MKLELTDSENPSTNLVSSSVEEENFLTYLNQLFSPKPPEVSAARQTLSIILQAGAIGVGAFSGIPYFAPALDFAGEYRFFGYLLGYGIVTSLGVVEAWALLDIVASLTSKSKAEKALSEMDYSILKETLYWIMTISLALAAAYSVATFDLSIQR